MELDELTGPLQEVFKDLQNKWKEFQEQEPFWHVVQGFAHAIDWTVSCPGNAPGMHDA